MNHLVDLLCLCLLCLTGKTLCDENVINVGRGADVVLPCSLSTKEDIEFKVFVWRKAPQIDEGQKEVFLYDKGIDNRGQSEEFKGRVSHFQDKLKHGDASITIRNTTLSDSGVYSCYFPRLQPRQTFYIKLVVEPKVRVTVEQGRDVVLPCSLRTKDNIEFKLFDWRKAPQKDEGLKEVFQYNNGIHYNNGGGGQSEEFKGRVSHFQDELKHGNASITIRNTKMADSGDYSCDFPRLQTPQIFYIQLDVEPSKVITVEEDSDVVLPCSLRTKEDVTSELFDWRKAPQTDEGLKEVFLYNKGIHYNNGLVGQSEEFKGRVSHFQDELKHGNASIIIRNTKISDSGVYNCHFPYLQTPQTFYIKLDVVGPEVITVKEGADVVLPCSLSTKEDIELKVFVWRKAPQKDEGQKEVFLYDKGINNRGQSDEFKGRVSHFPDELKHGDASITIRNTKISDSGEYSCYFPRLQPRQTFYIKLVVEPSKVIKVEEDSDVVLPCSLSTKEDVTSKLFDWKKDGGLKEVFLYDAGKHYNNGLVGQSEEFKGRVSHFQDELKHGDASITIRNTKVSDSGVYSCDFPNLQTPQTFYIKLVVGAAPKPFVTILEETKDRSLLQCEVHGDPEPEVEWRDSAGNTLPAEKTQVEPIGNLFYITLRTTVIQTDRYRCVATQETISHQVSNEIFVSIRGPKVITVDEGRDVVLPCSLSTKENIEFKLFDWRKAPQKDGGLKEVFFYNNGFHYNNGGGGQSEEFKGRVSHFQDELKHGNASITIRNTKISDSGDYSCDFPRLQTPQTFNIELVVEPSKVIKVEEDSDVVLPCSLRTKEDVTSKLFDWKKDGGLKKVFLYDAGKHYNNGLVGQSEEFKGRVSHFQDELKHSNASIIIRNTKVSDSGDYSCYFPNLQTPQTFYIKLVVGAAPKPYVTILNQTKDRSLLQCEVHGDPEPEVEWRDSAGNTLPAEKTQVEPIGNLFYITLRATVIQTDRYRCVATQETISHQVSNEIPVHFSGPAVVVVEEGRDVVLPCSLSPEEDTESELFDWRSDDQNDVFLYDNGRQALVCCCYDSGFELLGPPGADNPGPDSAISGNALSLGPDFTFQDDNAHPHRVFIRDYLQNLGVERVEWPASRPDLSPVEHW
ncbi:uncharacterized protein LOC117943374 [Etheostoma cragini]|uniref:uncharacterized protein LOC117943374 n=1 Tax=Etheostoma cragini TaxID=417921 RepID=UPI00155E1966|nr:uncharacterized protein LOC117943374 [Etheostoma cragini]